MEQLNHKKDSWLVWSFLTCLILALSLTLTGCGKKKKGGSTVSTPAPTQPGPHNCTSSNCGNYTDEIAAGLNQSYQTGFANLSMSLVVYAPGSNANNQGYYNGPVYVTGFLRVVQGNFIGCQLPAGDYDLYSTQAGGQYSSSQSTFNLNQIQATLKNRSSGATFPITLEYIEFKVHAQRQGPDGYLYPLSFYGQTWFCGNTSVFFPYES